IVILEVKEAADKIEQLDKGHKREINSMEKEISILKEESDKKDNKIKQTNSQLQESRLLILEFEEIRKKQDEIIKKSESKQQILLAELENTTHSLEDTKKMWFVSGALSGDGVDQVNDLIVLLLPCGVGKKELRDASDALVLELQNKSSELGMLKN
ncbi:hypothetical protein Chor_003969, partial [Crotalus horridus]